MLDSRMDFPGSKRVKSSWCKKMEWDVPPLPRQLDLGPQPFLPGPETSSQDLGSWAPEGQGSLPPTPSFWPRVGVPWCQGERGFVCLGTQV